MYSLKNEILLAIASEGGRNSTRRGFPAVIPSVSGCTHFAALIPLALHAWTSSGHPLAFPPPSEPPSTLSAFMLQALINRDQL